MLALKIGKYTGQSWFLSERRASNVKTECYFNVWFSSRDLPVLNSGNDKGIDAYLRIIES